MNESRAVRAGSWARTIHTPGPERRGGRDHGELEGRACALHPHHEHLDIDEVDTRWAIAWYRNIQSMTSRSGESHVAA